jgi:hypothetical protein
MRKIICLLLALFMIFTSIFSLTSCGSNEKIYLTLENYEQYLDVSASYYGEDRIWSIQFSQYCYENIVNRATITSKLPSAKFYDCIIKVRVIGEYYYTAYDKKTTYQIIKIPLNISGNGSDSKIENVYNENAHDIKNKGYEIVSVSGYIIVD